MIYQYRTKKASPPKCGDCGHALPGIPVLRPREYANLPKGERTVTRAYGGSRCASCVKNRILRAFLVEEHKLVKKVLKSKKTTEPSIEKKQETKTDMKKEVSQSSKKATLSKKQPASKQATKKSK